MTGKTTNGVAEHPLLLTALVLYSIVLGLPLAKFPPIDWPRQSDLFMASVVVMILVRMALTFYYGAVADRYPGQLFILEVTVAGILAWQIRVLLDDRVDGPGSRLWLFYVLHLALVVSMVVWSRILLTSRLVAPLRVVVLRWVGVAAAVVGLALESPGVPDEIRMDGRWMVAILLMMLATVYAVGRPWQQFDAGTRDDVKPAGSGCDRAQRSSD